MSAVTKLIISVTRTQGYLDLQGYMHCKNNVIIRTMVYKRQSSLCVTWINYCWWCNTL